MMLCRPVKSYFQSYFRSGFSGTFSAPQTEHIGNDGVRAAGKRASSGILHGAGEGSAGIANRPAARS